MATGYGPNQNDDQGFDGFTDLAARGGFEELLRQRLGEVYGASPWLVAAEMVQGGLKVAAKVGSVTEQPIMVVSARTGVGPIAASVPAHTLELPWEASLMANARSAARALAEPPGEVAAAVDRWDTDRRAKVIMTMAGPAERRFGRAVFGRRPQAWVDLEDKLAIEDLWAAAGIPVAPSARVAADDPVAAVEAHKRLATSLGTVWAGDNHSGWHGGAEGTFWVGDEAQAAAMGRRLAGFRYIRIMPFVDGIPCSVHGMVVPDGTGGRAVVVFRPCEMMMLRDPKARTFVYGRASTFWDPDPADREAMRETTRLIGCELHRRVDYRGVYTVDGVLGADGFVPTEVNTRYGAALRSETATVTGPDIELLLLHIALVDGQLDDLDLRPLDRWVTADLDGSRWAGGSVEIDRVPSEERLASVGWSPSGELVAVERSDESASDEPASDGSPDLGFQPVAEVRWGAALGGGMLAVTGTEHIPIGPPTAPLLAETIRAVDRLWSLGVPPLAAARPAR